MGRLIRAAATVLVVAGSACLAWVGWQLADAWLYQQWARHDFEEARTAAPAPLADSSGTPSPLPDSLQEMQIAIPRIGIAAMIVYDSGAAGLRRGVAHIPGTASFGQPGNVGLAAHRDTYFRKLRDIAAGDTIQVAAPGAEYRYVVDWTRIVRPEAVQVLDATPEPALTLVTCYPFHYVGPAPQRFIVRARHIALGAD